MIRKNIKEKIMEYFFIYPTARLRVREIERILELPVPSVIRYCKELEEDGILNKVKTGSVSFYTSDRTNEKFLREKRSFNIRQLSEKGILQHLKIEFHNPIIVIFGSYSKGEDVENSDIDIYVETPSKKEIDLAKFEKALKRKVHLFKYKSLSEIKNPNLSNNIINGIVLNGFVEVFK